MASVAKKRILFVDDEPAILEGLQNLLYKDRKRWHMVFAPGGDTALAEIAKQPFDVVVSDMRMPGVDGATLLNEVKLRHPSTARIMLSGHAEKEAIVRALPALHQLLAKPCNAETLRAAIERGLELASTSRDERVRSVIGRLDRLPSPPELYLELTRTIGSKTAEVEDVAAVVRRDPALAAKVLQLVNSAYFGSGTTISSVRHAITVLGLERIRYIAMMSSVFEAAENPLDELSMTDLQTHSFGTAAIAAALLPERADDAFAAGLLHDVGRLILALGMTDEYRTVLRRTRSTGEPATDVETDMLGLDHADVGACLLGVWGLPAPLVDAVGHHHAPDRAAPEDRLVAAAVHVADAFADEGEVDVDAVERAGLRDRVASWMASGPARRT
jgi:HD-like signal output (HDOD) protein/CheY-like chemotaxis protein